MAFKVKAICSECLTMHACKLDYDMENIKCPACGHSLKNLPETELTLIESTIKSQRNSNIVAIVGLLMAVAGFLLWAFHQFPELYYHMEETVRIAHQMDEIPPADGMKETFYPVIGGLGLLLTMIFGILGARKRYVLEF